MVVVVVVVGGGVARRGAVSLHSICEGVCVHVFAPTLVCMNATTTSQTHTCRHTDPHSHEMGIAIFLPPSLAFISFFFLFSRNNNSCNGCCVGGRL